MGRVSRILSGFFAEDDGKSGLFEKSDGTVWYRKPDGSEAEVGSGGSQPSLTDVGVIDAVGLLGGPQTLLTPSVGELLALWPRFGGYVHINHQSISVSQGPTLTSPYGINGESLLDIVNWADPNTLLNGWRVAMRSYVTDTADDLVAVLVTDSSSLAVTEALAAWQAGHVYGGQALILGDDDHIWSANVGGGTSGGLIPDFAGNEGGTVVDNTVTWTDEGAIPSTGLLHLYAQTATT